MLEWPPCSLPCSSFFFFNDTATTEIYTLSLHDALPIFRPFNGKFLICSPVTRPEVELMVVFTICASSVTVICSLRSEEHTSELQSRPHLVCRLLLEKKKHPPAGDRVAAG